MSPFTSAIEKLERPGGALLAPLYAVHRRGEEFFNPWAPFPHTLGDLVRFWIRPGLRGAVRRIEPARRLPEIGERGASITFVGHCTFVIREPGAALLTDPHWGPRAKARRRKTVPGLALEQVPPDALASSRTHITTTATATRWRDCRHRHGGSFRWASPGG